MTTRLMSTITVCFFAILIGCTTTTPTPTSLPPTDAPTSMPPTATQTSTPAPTDTSIPVPATDTATATFTPLPTDTPEPVNATEPVFITYQDFEIVPAETTISVGTQVIFLIKGSVHQPYNFDAPNTFEAQANLGDGATYSFTFNEAGTVTLLCGYHPNMAATLFVTP